MQEWKKEYLNVLKYRKKLFEKDFGIKLHETFDPIRWIRGYRIKKPEIRWDNFKYYEEENSSTKKCEAIDIWMLVYSELDEDKDYMFRIKYKPYGRDKTFYPYEYEHCCDDTFSWGISGVRLHCKHLYGVLVFIDENVIPKHLKIRIAKTTFRPNQKFLSQAQKIVDSREKVPQKLELIFDLMSDELSLKEGYYLKRLNKRLEYLKKV